MSFNEGMANKASGPAWSYKLLPLVTTENHPTL